MANRREIALFTPGPSATIEEVTDIAHPALRDFMGTKRPIGTISHRHKVVDDLITDVLVRFRRLTKLPPTHEVLLCPGGARNHFVAVWLNLLHVGKKPRCGIVDSGHWARVAGSDAFGLDQADFIDLRTIASSEKEQFRCIKDPAPRELEGLDLVYLTTNETVNGTGRPWIGLSHAVPAILDMSSDIMTYSMDWNEVAVAIASTQKNLGLAGFTVVIVRKDMLGGHPAIPAPLRYRLQLETRGGLADTISVPALYSIYLTLQHIEIAGGVDVMDDLTDEKATMLYRAIDDSQMFKGIAEEDSRSRTNVTFQLQSEQLHDAFLAACEEEQLYDLKGHAGAFKLYGPHLRASLYIAVKKGWVERLVDVIREFERTH